MSENPNTNVDSSAMAPEEPMRDVVDAGVGVRNGAGADAPQSERPAQSGWFCFGVWLLRLVIGGVFAFSGLVKGIDLWGFVLKIEEYLAVWQFSQPRSVTFMLALLISGYEFVLGVLTLMGCYKRSAPWGLMLSMVVMLPLTLYLWIADPVSDCGCFGDFVTLSNGATFWKNVFITAGLVALIRWNARLKQSLFNPAIQWMVCALVALYIIVVGLYGYNAQPVLDFRSYPVGTRLAVDGGEEAANGAADDEAAYLFVYEKDGHTERFTIDNLPDSTWTFVDREADGDMDDSSDPANQLSVFNSNGDDVTADVFLPEGEQYVVVIPEPRRADVAYTYTLNEIYDEADSIGIAMIAILGTDAQGVSRWQDMAMADYPCFSADETQLKELARGNIAMVVLSDGVITSKTTLNSMNPEVVENPVSPDLFRNEILGYGARWFHIINVFFGTVLLLIYLFQGIIITIRAKTRAKFGKHRCDVDSKTNNNVDSKTKDSSAADNLIENP